MESPDKQSVKSDIAKQLDLIAETQPSKFEQLKQQILKVTVVPAHTEQLFYVYVIGDSQVLIKLRIKMNPGKTADTLHSQIIDEFTEAGLAIS